MSLSGIIGFIFGLALLYLLLCVICSGLQEAVAGLRHQRAESYRPRSGDCWARSASSSIATR